MDRVAHTLEVLHGSLSQKERLDLAKRIFDEVIELSPELRLTARDREELDESRVQEKTGKTRPARAAVESLLRQLPDDGDSR